MRATDALAPTRRVLSGNPCDGPSYYRRERSFGSLERSFQVPEGIDTDKIPASFKNGILSMTLPKSAEAQKQAKKIVVKAG